MPRRFITLLKTVKSKDILKIGKLSLHKKSDNLFPELFYQVKNHFNLVFTLFRSQMQVYRQLIYIARTCIENFADIRNL